MIDLLLTPVVVAMGTAADVAGWAAGRIADAAERGAVALTEIAETARLVQTLSGACP